MSDDPKVSALEGALKAIQSFTESALGQVPPCTDNFLWITNPNPKNFALTFDKRQALIPVEVRQCAARHFQRFIDLVGDNAVNADELPSALRSIFEDADAEEKDAASRLKSEINVWIRRGIMDDETFLKHPRIAAIVDVINEDLPAHLKIRAEDGSYIKERPPQFFDTAFETRTIQVGEHLVESHPLPETGAQKIYNQSDGIIKAITDAVEDVSIDIDDLPNAICAPLEKAKTLGIDATVGQKLFDWLQGRFEDDPVLFERPHIIVLLRQIEEYIPPDLQAAMDALEQPNNGPPVLTVQKISSIDFF